MLSGTEESEEVAQTAMLALHQSLDRFEGRCAWSTWVYQVTLNAIRSFRRQRGMERQRVAPSAPEAFDRLPAATPDALGALGQAELAATVDRALAALPAEQREVLVLRSVEGLSTQEVASLLGCPVGTVKSRLHNAHAKLARSLASEGRGEDR